MFASCFASQDVNSFCDFFLRLQDFFSWIDQRVNLNEGVIALVAFLGGIGMQNFEGARRVAGIGFLVVAVLFGVAAVLEGPSRTLRGVAPFRVIVPSVFRNVHESLIGRENSILATDEAGKNSVQLLSGDLVTFKDNPQGYLRSRCSGEPNSLASHYEIDDPKQIVFSLTPVYRGPNACFFSWHERGVPVDHYEVYVVHHSAEIDGWEYARLDLRADELTRALVNDDYVLMRDSLLKSAGIDPPTSAH
ncbi:MAG: hypothetical protein ABSD74_09470 [Rhizomicrobium sp.]|jgi:hypothetical protein